MFMCHSFMICGFSLMIMRVSHRIDFFDHPNISTLRGHHVSWLISLHHHDSSSSMMTVHLYTDLKWLSTYFLPAWCTVGKSSCMSGMISQFYVPLVSCKNSSDLLLKRTLFKEVYIMVYRSVKIFICLPTLD